MKLIIEQQQCNSIEANMLERIAEWIEDRPGKAKEYAPIVRLFCGTSYSIVEKENGFCLQKGNVIKAKLIEN